MLVIWSCSVYSSSTTIRARLWSYELWSYISLHTITIIVCWCRVFWCDVHSVQSVSVDGSTRITHVMSPVNNFVAISLHRVRLISVARYVTCFTVPLASAQHVTFFLSTYTGRAKKSNPLGKILYLWNCSRYIYQICRVYRWGFSPHILQILLK